MIKRNTIRTRLILLVLIAGMGAAVLNWRVGQRSTKEKTAPSLNTDVTASRDDSLVSSTPPSLPSIGTAPVATEAVSASNVSRVHEFNEAKDYRVLLQSFLNSSAQGVRLYAITILSICERAREGALNLAMPANSREQEAAKQLLVSRCGSFSSQEVGSEYVYSVVKDSRLAIDPLSSLLNDLGRASQEQDNARRLSLIAKILELQDPVLLERASMFGVEADGSVRFDGGNLTQANAPVILTLALQSANCVTGLDCGARNPDVVSNCALADQCFSDRQTLNRNQVFRDYGEEGLSLYEQVLPKIEAALRNKDPSVFR